jgi:hypothetical protein
MSLVTGFMRQHIMGWVLFPIRRLVMGEHVVPVALVDAVLDAADRVEGCAKNLPCEVLLDSPEMWRDTPDGPNDAEHEWGAYAWGYELEVKETFAQSLVSPAEHQVFGSVWIDRGGREVWRRGAKEIW